MDFDSLYKQMRAEVHAYARMGLDVQTFISAVQDPAKHPKRDSNGAVVLNRKTGLPEPAFCGKNPSYWTGDAEPILQKPNKPCSHQDAIQRIDNAERLRLPIGIGIIPKEPVVVIDIDQKRYELKADMDTEVKHMAALCPQLRNTRVESTPGGGWHIVVKVKDLSEWRQSSGGLHCNFSTSPNGPHRGEILTGGSRFCISAPSQRYDGLYKVCFAEYANTLIEIDRLSDIGIYPSVQKENRHLNVQALPLPSRGRCEQDPQEGVGTEEHLRQLITEKAERVLQGDLAFKAEDRSGTLAALGNELYSWNNVASEYGYDFTGAIDNLFQEAVIALGCEEKCDRVFKTLNHNCCFTDLEWARKRFINVMQIHSGDSIADMPQRPAAQNGSPSKMNDIEITVEDALNELIRLSSADRINAKELLPPYLQEALSVIGDTIEYDWGLILTVLMVGISGAMPLDSSITLIPGDFDQPLIIWAILLLDTGELKSPLVKRLIMVPWRTSVDVVMKQRYQDAIKEWKRLKSEQPANDGDLDIPQPKKAQTIITEDRTPQGIERHFMLHERFAKGSILLVIDEAKDILAEMSGKDSSTGTLKFGSWILSRYDGSGGRGAKADEQYERHYSECRLAALFCCQSKVYRAITGDADLTGLAARFLAVEQNTVNQKFPTKFDDSHQKRHEDLRSLLSDLYSFICSQSSIHLELTDEALALLQAERQYLQDRKNQSLSDAERGLLNKCHGRIGRIAGVFHLLWAFNPHRPRERLIDTKVGAETMKRAIEWNRYLLAETVLVRQTSSDNSIAMQKIQAFHNTALKVKKSIRITELRVKPVSSMRLINTEAELVAWALHRLGYGRVSTDDKGKLCYQALKPLSA
jgi:hypothetical protein